MQAYNLDDFNLEFSDEDYANQTRAGFQPERCYHLVIDHEAVTTTDSGFLQLELHVSRISENGDTTKAGRIWQTLPIFTKDKESELGTDKTRFFRQLFRDQLLNLLRATNPSEWQAYTDKRVSGNKKEYFDAEGNKLSSDQLSARRTDLNRQTLTFAKALISGQASLVDKSFYYVEVPGKKEGQVYRNYYSAPAQKFPMFGEDTSTPF